MSVDETRIAMRVAANYAGVLQKVAEAAFRAGRNASDVTVVAITKYVEAKWIQPLYEAGCRDFGEARPQELWNKVESLADLSDARWHMIGHLQRNKVARTVPCTDLIHSVDSKRLLRAINQQAGAARHASVLLEVNISGDSAKHGFREDELDDVLAQIDDFSHVEVSGFMGMAGLGVGDDATRAQFRGLRERMVSAVKGMPPSSAFQHLSMGMSQDFEIAIEEGATIVRVGSALFEGCGLR